MAKLYFSYSTMNAGKSTLLLQAAHNYREQGMHTLTFTSALHQDLHDGQVSSRLGISSPAIAFHAGDDLFATIERSHRGQKVDCVFVDEAQFLAPEQVWQLARVADRLGIPVLCYGLRTDFRGELFPGSAVLLAIADSLREVRTICHCGSKATMVLRRDPTGAVTTTGAQIAVEKSMYVSLCRRHWEEQTGHLHRR
ncbi:MAG: thymidine kinase [Planctomycetes bacterium]|nr:thymidine kinase [Planctomycetota bacterium]